MKESLQRGEDAAFWMSQKTREIIEATNLDRPLKQMDSMAARTIEDMEKKTKKVILFFHDSAVPAIHTHSDRIIFEVLLGIYFI